MAQNPIKSALDATRDVAQQAQDQFESVLRDLSAAVEAQSAQVQAVLQDLIDRSRENSDRVVEAVDKQVDAQLHSLGIATKADIARLERKLAKLDKRTSPKRSSAKTGATRASGKKARSSTAS